jgi:hypothetical protein
MTVNDKKNFVNFVLKDCYTFFIKKGKALAARKLLKQVFLVLIKKKILENESLPIFFKLFNTQIASLTPKIGFVYKFIKKRNKKIPVGLTTLQQKNTLLRWFANLVRRTRQPSKNAILNEFDLISKNDEMSRLHQSQLIVHKKAVELKGLVKKPRYRFFNKKLNDAKKSNIEKKLFEHFSSKKISKATVELSKKISKLKFAIYNNSDKRRLFKRIFNTYFFNEA